MNSIAKNKEKKRREKAQQKRQRKRDKRKDVSEVQVSHGQCETLQRGEHEH